MNKETAVVEIRIELGNINNIANNSLEELTVYTDKREFEKIVNLFMKETFKSLSLIQKTIKTYANDRP